MGLVLVNISHANVQSQMALTQVGTNNAIQWNYIDVVNNEFKLWYNPTSVHTVQTFFGKQYQQAWFKQEIMNDINPLDDVNVGDYSLDLWRVNCTTLQVGMVKSLSYKKSGVFVGQVRVPIVHMKDIVPSTAGQAIFNRVCANVTVTKPST